MVKRIIGIWAEDEQGLIGREGGLPWRLPKDLQHFKQTTLGHTLLMGRVTFDGMNRRLLPGRSTLVLSSDASLESHGVTVLSSLEQVLDWYDSQQDSLYIVGGAKVYKAFEPYYDELIKTEVAGVFEGDTYFPEMDWSCFELVASQAFDKDDENPHAFSIKHFARRKDKKEA